jgi:3-methylcrotonyl-CoA carboxylase beta subunit
LWTIKKDQLAAEGKTPTGEEEKSFKTPILDKYEIESSAYYSTARIWDDGIIDPIDTRKVLAMGISMSLGREWEPRVQGVFRM